MITRSALGERPTSASTSRSVTHGRLGGQAATQSTWEDASRLVWSAQDLPPDEEACLRWPARRCASPSAPLANRDQETDNTAKGGDCSERPATTLGACVTSRHVG